VEQHPRTTTLVISLLLALHFGFNLYLQQRWLAPLVRGWSLEQVAMIAFWLLPASFVAGRILELHAPVAVASPFLVIGAYWIGAMSYLVPIQAMADLLGWLLRLAGPTTHELQQAVNLGGRWRLLTTLAVLLALAAGRLNAARPIVRRLELRIPKPLPDHETLTVVAISDLHLGTLIGAARLARIVERINALQPDVILLLGDVLDESVPPVVREDIGAGLSRLQARCGVFAITGNHEYIGGVGPATRYLEQKGLRLLRDEVVTLPCGLQLAGREDLVRPRFTGQPRRPLKELLAHIDPSRPVILLDHQPWKLDQAAALGVDLQLSGHTHHGQLWPFQLVTRLVYDLSHGYARRGATQFYVTCGVGTWGPPVRLSSRPEIMEIRLRFQPDRP
jgi:hypothetical protein